MFLYRIYKAASAETRFNQLMTITLHTDWNAAVFEELCSLIIAGCQKLSVTTNNVKSPKISKYCLKKTKRLPQVWTGRPRWHTEQKPYLYPIWVAYEKKHVITMHKSCYVHRDRRTRWTQTQQPGLGLKLMSLPHGLYLQENFPKGAHHVSIVVLKNISRIIKPAFPNFKDKCTEFWRGEAAYKSRLRSRAKPIPEPKTSPQGELAPGCPHLGFLPLEAC